jgi:transposase
LADDDLTALQSQLEQVAADRDQAVSEREHYRELYLGLLEKCRKLEVGILGQKSERLPANESQLSMALLATLLGDRAEDAAEEGGPVEKQTVKEHERQKPTGRKPLPENLPRVEIEVLPPEVEREGKDAFERIGAETCEVLERRRASLVVVRTVRGKWVRKDRERCAETKVFVAPPPGLPIERGLAGPGLLADTIVKRWEDHLPLHRQEKIFAREGVEIARSSICQWHIALADLAKQLLLAMWKDAFASPYLCTDATGVLVRDAEKCRTGHFWVVVAPGRHVLYAYTPRHDSAAVDTILAGFKGYLVADAHAVYDHLFATGDVIEVACWAHARRYFFKALETEPERARQALALLGALFRIERPLANGPPGRRHSVRQRESKPVVERFFAWCDAEAPRVLDETPIARAIGYARNQRDALSRFLTDGQLPLHNNDSERALRREVVGRKNWLFLGSDDGGSVNATFVSLLASCRLHGIEPWSYLRDLFCLLSDWPVHRVLELAPANWQKTCEQKDTQQRLAANVYRPITLESPAPHRPST